MSRVKFGKKFDVKVAPVRNAGPKGKPRKPRKAIVAESKATLLRLRGEELDELHVRIVRLEATVASSMKLRDDSAAAERDRVTGLDKRLVQIEAALYGIAAKYLNSGLTAPPQSHEPVLTPVVIEPSVDLGVESSKTQDSE